MESCGKMDQGRLDRNDILRICWKYEGLPYAVDKVLLHLEKYGPERREGFGNPYISDADKLKVIQSLEDWMADARKSPSADWVLDLIAFEEKSRDKWYGPQGATPSSYQLEEALSGYFEHAQKPFIINLTPSDHVLAEWKSQTHSVSGALTAHQLWQRYKGDRKSNSGITGWCDRRDPAIRKMCISLAKKHPITFDPIVTGTRVQRNKVCRVIFMDSLANYFREVEAFWWLQDVWKDSSSVAWRGDRYVEADLDAFIRKSTGSLLWFEADYETFDQWILQTHFQWLFDNAKKVGLIDETIYNKAVAAAKALYQAPIWSPSGEHLGPRTLLSGIYPTNPMETPLNLLIQLQFVEWLAGLLGCSSNPMHLGIDFFIVINGDDSLIVFDLGLHPELANLDLKRLFADWVWENFRIKAKAEKQRVSPVSGFFCKRQYKVGGYMYDPLGLGHNYPKSLYPIYLALNSIFNPEDGALDKKAQSLIKIFAVFDGAFGHPGYKRVLRKLWEVTPELHIPITQADVDIYNELHNKNWRLVIFGEKFSLENSPTAQLWFKWSK